MPSPMMSLGRLRGGLHPQQLLHIYSLGIQRLPKVPVRVNRRRDIWFGMTEHRLVDRDVLVRMVRPDRARADCRW